MRQAIDLDRLAELALDLESGHPIEKVLRKHGQHERWSAYDVVVRHQKDRAHLASAVSDHYKKYWKDAVKELEPCIKAIAKELGL